MKRILLLAVVACVAVACWTEGAVAGNGNGGTPPGQAKQADATTAQPAAQPTQGNPNAPGQQKKAATSSGSSTSPGQAKQQAKASASTPGVKPSSTTSKRTTCYTGGTTASPTCTPGTKADSSKQYGNGKTAAQIATSRGAPAGTAIYGPGNSQPHKVTSCKHPLHGKGGGVDVHAVKSYSSTDCSTLQQQSHEQSEQQSTKVETNNGATPAVTPVVTPALTPVLTPATPAAAATQPNNGVLGAQATVTHLAKNSPGGVLGVAKTLGRVGTRATLPFTGFPLWIAVLAGLALVAVGMTARRARATR